MHFVRQVLLLAAVFVMAAAHYARPENIPWD